MKNVALYKQTTKKRLYLVRELKQEDRSSPHLTSVGNLSTGRLKMCPHSKHVLEWPQKCHASIDFQVKNKFLQVVKFTNMEPVNNEDQLYLWFNFVIRPSQVYGEYYKNHLTMCITPLIVSSKMFHLRYE